MRSGFAFESHAWRRWLWLAVVLAAPVVTSAHVRWFVEREYPPRWELLASLPTLAVVVASVALYGLLRGLRALVGSPHFPNPAFLAHLEPCSTTLLAVQTGISLVFIASQRALFAPNLDLPPTVLGWALVALQVAVAFTFITGLFDRAGAVLIVLAFLLGFLLFPAYAMVEQLLFVGIGVILAILGRTVPPVWVARHLRGVGAYEASAVAALRILTGTSVLVLGFTEKLLAPESGIAFLREYPAFNVPRALLGLTWFSDELFVYSAGVAEATIGVLLITGVLTRVVILGMWVPFNLTVSFLPPVELLGHLPIFGIMYVLLLYGSGLSPRAEERVIAPALADDSSLRMTGKSAGPAS